jgi:pterin-4a-carbinolamine dehydratase
MTEWPKDNQGRLTKTFAFKNYRKSFAFTSQVAMLSEKKKSSPSNHFRLRQCHHRSYFS